MTSHLTRLLRSSVAMAVAVVAFGSLAPAPVPADDGDLVASALTVRREREGKCRVGPAEWSLKVRRISASRIRINFHVDEVGRHTRWQVFVGDNGQRVAAVSRTSNRSGEFDLERYTRNRSGRDHVAASAVNPRSGNMCKARIRL